MSIVTAIMCDGCGEVYGPRCEERTEPPDSLYVRCLASNLGWAIARAGAGAGGDFSGDLDFCGTCVRAACPGVIFGDSNGPVWGWFGLTYSAYLVLQRSVLCAMPVGWQERLVVLLRQLEEAVDTEKLPGSFWVRARSGRRFVADPWSNYRHPPPVPMRATAQEPTP